MNENMSEQSMASFIHGLPKAELHIHIEGSLEPELMFELAKNNGVDIAYRSAAEVRAAYAFTDLQSFLDLYYDGARVLVEQDDFYALAFAYARTASAQNVRHAEVFFDPQTHTDRGVSFETVITGLRRAFEDAHRQFGMTSKLIPCFLRHLSAESALETLEQALPFKDWIVAVGLDSSELGHPPTKFAHVFEEARRHGFETVAHAGEEGPPDYIAQALDLLHVSRIDHGVRCLEDPDLVERLRRERIPLTVCPLSNVKLGVFPTLGDHNLVELLDAGLCVSLNSDDPAYFGGYIEDNFLAAQEALGLSRSQLRLLSRNAFEASFLDEDAKQVLIAELDRYSE